MVKFYNREHLIVDTFFPLIPSDGLAVEKGGFWSNPVTRYGFTYLSQAYGKVYVVHGKMPSTPRTWDGDPAPMNQDADMRYWSLCTSTAPPIGNTVDCVTDENVAARSSTSRAITAWSSPGPPTARPMPSKSAA